MSAGLTAALRDRGAEEPSALGSSTWRGEVTPTPSARPSTPLTMGAIELGSVGAAAGATRAPPLTLNTPSSAPKAWLSAAAVPLARMYSRLSGTDSMRSPDAVR